MTDLMRTPSFGRPVAGSRLRLHGLPIRSGAWTVGGQDVRALAPNSTSKGGALPYAGLPVFEPTGSAPRRAPV